MITKEGYKRLFHFLVWMFIAVIVFLVGMSNIFAEEQKTGLGYLNNSTVIISNNKGVDVNLSRNTANSVNMDIKTIIFQSNYAFQKNVVYEYEVELGNQYLNNINSVSITSGNNICSFISLQGMNSSYLKIRFSCPDSVNYLTISLSNLNNSSITNGYNIRWNTIYLWSITDTINLGPIINNDNSNTNNIINNNNQNTQDIIDNNDENTQKIIDENKKNFNDCTSYDFNNDNIPVEDGYLSDDGSIILSASWEHTDYISIEKNKHYTFTKNYNAGIASYCYYNSNKVLINCVVMGNTNNFDLSFNQNGYLRLSLNKSFGNISFIGDYCSNKLDEQKNAINNLDDTLKDDKVDDNGVADAFESFNDFLDNNSTITQLITLPITLYTAIINNVNGSCSPFNLGALYGEDLILPCINISQYLGNSLWTMIDIIISGFAVYAISKKMIKVFNNFSSLREGDVIDD